MLGFGKRKSVSPGNIAAVVSGQIIPIEVKAADNTRAKSLRVYMDTYHPAYAIKLSAKNFGFEDNKKTVPLYAAFCL